MTIGSYYEFEPFILDTNSQCLIRDEKHISLQPKTYAVLLYLIQNAGRTVSRDELMEAVWGLSISEGVLSFQINLLRKQLGDAASSPKYIQTITKRGFQFIASVKEIQKCPGKLVELEDKPDAAKINVHLEPEKPQEIVQTRQRITGVSRRLIISASVLSIVMVIAIGLYYRNIIIIKRADAEIHSAFDETEIRRVVRDSQFFETLNLYTDPKSAKREDLEKYWLPAEQGGKEINQVLAALKRLQGSGWHYGKESKCEMFEFATVNILAQEDYAEIETIERWYIPTYRDDGSRVLERNVYIGPQKMAYKLKKIDGKWLIEETTVPRPRKE